MSAASFSFAMNTTTAVVVAISLLGNLLSIIIFSRKTFRNNSISTYCIALSLNEFLSLFKFITNISVVAFNVAPADQSDAFCRFYYYIFLIYAAVQPGIMVAFSVDKLLSMRTSGIPLLKKKWFQWSVVAGIVLFNMLLYIVQPILIKRREIAPGRFFCDQNAIGFLPTLMIVMTLDSCIIPFILMIASSILTIRVLVKSRNSVAKNGNVSKDRKSRDRKYAVSSVAFNIMFLVFKSPVMVYYIFFSFYNYYDVYFFNIAVFFAYLNPTAFFFIHLVTNSLFRREFLVLIGLVKRNGETSSVNTNTNKLTKALNRVTPMNSNVNI